MKAELLFFALNASATYSDDLQTLRSSHTVARHHAVEMFPIPQCLTCSALTILTLVRLKTSEKQAIPIRPNKDMQWNCLNVAQSF